MREETARKLKERLEQGRLGPARDLLNALVLAYPDDLDLRRQLAEVYWKLGYPEHAGRFWFLEEKLDARQERAVRTFLVSCGDKPEVAMHRLKLRLEFESLGPTARARLEQLTPDLMKILQANNPKEPGPRYKPTLKDKFTGGFCAIAVALAIIFMMIGLGVTLKQLF